MNRRIKKSLVALTALMTMGVQSMNAVVISVTVKNDSCQKVTGFGAAAMGTLMRPVTDPGIIEKAYGQDSPVGLNILRMEVSANLVGDVNDGWDTPYDWHGYLPAVKMARSKGAIILGTPWSPPAAYKTNNSASGGKIDGDEANSVRGQLSSYGYTQFFPWLNTYVNYMKNNGAPVDVVAIQNEPDFWVGYNGCLYTPDEMFNLVKKYGKRFNKKSGVKLMGGEPFYFNEEYARRLLEDEDTRSIIDCIGGHIYGSKPMANMKNACAIATKYGKETWMTEHTVDPQGDENKIYDVPRWQDEITFAQELNESMLAGINAYVYWYLYQRFGMIGDGESVPSGGNKDGEILPRGYVMSHFAKHLPGAYRVNTASNVVTDVGNIERSAYLKGDSIIVITINNTSTAKDLKFTFPYYVTEGKRISSTSLTSLCVETPVKIDGAVRVNLMDKMEPYSINTFIFKMDKNITGIRDVEAESNETAEAARRRAVYTLSGQRVTEMTPGQIYVVDGRKVMAE